MRQTGTLSRDFTPVMPAPAFAWRSPYTTLVLIAIVVAVGVPGLTLGYGSHGDSRAIFEASVNAILRGHYAPSRSYGVPLFEYVAAILEPHGGLWLVNLYSLALSIASVIVFASLLDQPESTAKPSAKAWALAGFALNPLFLINASSPTEWAQAMLLLIGAVSCVLGWMKTGSIGKLAMYGACISGLVLSRPDFSVFCLALGVAVVWHLKDESRARVEFVVTTAVAGIFTASVFMVLNGGPAFFLRAGEMVGDQIGVRRALVAVAGVVDLFGIAGCVAIVIGTVALVTKRAGGTSISFFEKIALLAWPILFARAAVLPDKLEYLFPLIPITLLAFASKRQLTVLTAIVACSLILNSFVAVSLFERPEASDRLAFAIHTNKGAVLQDWDARQAQARALESSFKSDVAAAYGGTTAEHLTFKNFNPGYTDDQNNLILSKDELYKMDNPRFSDVRYARKSYKRIYVCNSTFIADNVGWRVLQPPPVYADFGDVQGAHAVRCGPE